MPSRVVMNAAGLAELARRVDRMEEHTAEDVADDAYRGCPIDTGALRASIRAVGNRVYVGGPGPAGDYWAATEYGSHPHVIESHGDYPLRNRETGQVFGPRVWHPGTPAQPFMRPAIMRRRTPRL